MTTFLYQNNCFYADTRAYVNGQPFNISGKVVSLDEPIKMKATLDKGSVKPIVLDDIIYGYFITHAVEPGRALFNMLVVSATQLEGSIENVIDNYARFFKEFKLGGYDSHFTLTLIGDKGTYSISNPTSINQDMSYEFSPYVHSVTEARMAMSYGANHEFLTAQIAAGAPVIIAYYKLFLSFVESGGNVESWFLRDFKDGKRLVRREWFPEVTPEKMREAITDWELNRANSPIAEMTAIYVYGPAVLSLSRLERHLEDKGYSVKRDDSGIINGLAQSEVELLTCVIG